MKTPSVRALALLAAFTLLGIGSARAESIDFGYSWTVLPSSVIPGGTGSVTLATPTPVPADGTVSAILGAAAQMIPGATVTTTTSANPNGTPPTPADSYSTPFSMQVTLTDGPSSLSSTLTFAGTLS